MNQINIARAIICKRKEKGVTQEELANHIGVSIAAVSKWETSQSYPDILLLPQLAAYFNISIDDLMGYEPQMSKHDIGKLYAKLYGEMSTKPLDEVIESCRETIKKYFSCFPLLMQMGTLLINAGNLTGDKAKTTELIAEAKALFARVKAESDNLELGKSALYMEAICESLQGNHGEVIELLGKPSTNMAQHEVLLSSAYRMTGRSAEAETVLQVAIFQNMMAALSLLGAYLMLGIEDSGRFDEVAKRTFLLIESFNIKSFQPGIIISIYLTTAQGYLALQQTEKALDLLEQYTELVENDISTQITGDSFFNLIDDWLNEEGVEHPVPIPPHESIKQSLADAVAKNQMFSALGDNPRFKAVVKRLDACAK